MWFASSVQRHWEDIQEWSQADGRDAVEAFRQGFYALMSPQ